MVSNRLRYLDVDLVGVLNVVDPLVKHRVFAPYDHAHNARIKDELSNQRSMIEMVNSAVKRSYDSPVRAREWYR